MRKYLFLFMCAGMVTSVFAGTWTRVFDAAMPDIVKTDGILVKAANVGPAADVQPVTVKGVPFDTDTGNISGGDIFGTNLPDGKYHTDPNDADLFNLLNTWKRDTTYSNPHIMLEFNGLEVGMQHRLQMFTGWSWKWARYRAVGPEGEAQKVEYKSGSNVKGVNVLEYIWTPDTPSAIFLLEAHDSEDAGDLMGYVLHDIGSNPFATSSPSPWNGQTRLEFDNTILSWQPGSHAIRHRIWFGAGEPANMVIAAEQDLGNEQYDPGDLMLNTTYYWRIDEVNDDSSVTSGNLWQFTTETEDVDPLLIFDAQQLEGTGVRVDIDTIYNGDQIPGGLDNQISSFRLAKGYMATVADGSDGTGPSKNYIAYDQDMEVPNLPMGLDNAVSFIRVLPWQEHVKKGTGGDLPEMNADWYYNWSRGGTSTASREYVPMSWGKSGTDPDAILDYLDLDQVTHLLGFNESDDCNGQSGQYYNLCQQDVAVGYYENLMQTGLRLGSPGCREGGVFNWLPEFMDLAEAQDIRVDFIAMHWYDWASNPSVNTNPWPIEVFNRFINKLSDVYHYYRKPIWITEFNANIYRERSIQDTFLEFALPYLDRIGYVERYAYFQPSTGTGDFYDEQGQLTSTGLIYKNHESTPYYTPGTLPSPWRSMDIGGYKAPGIALYGNGVYTVCSSGNDIWDTSDELHYVYQPVTGDGEILVQVNSMLKTHDSAKAGLMIRQSPAADSRYAMMAMTPKDGAKFQYRVTDGGETSQAVEGDCEPPYWIKLVRQGDAFTGYRCMDGISWSMMGTCSISMDEAVYVGMCVCARNNHASFQDATLSNLRLSWPKSADINGNSFVDLQDIEKLFEHWLDPECMRSLPCLKVDLDYSKTIDLSDFVLLAGKWQMEVSEPSEPPSGIIVGGDILNGNFNNLVIFNTDDTQPYSNTVSWENIGTGGQDEEATRITPESRLYDRTRNLVLCGGAGRVSGLDTGYTITEGDVFDISYVWQDAFDWDDATDEVRVTLFVTDDDTISGTRTNLVVDLSGTSTQNDTFEPVYHDGIYAADTDDIGKRLFVEIDTTATDASFGRLDNFVLNK